uniref:DUF551 domain-containing protein n=1 Tax=Siphoviridae sp. ctmIh35 TaxID=2827932 RepID=A0A8S5T8L5_9CAUD|nr:MAG TPA: Protein of unknown function (DUF551) [Siphoviridae sp. ctmIh35]
MTIDEAKKNLVAYVYFAAEDIPSAVAQALDTVVKAVERTRWIPFSEKIPEKYGDYLCCNEYGEYIIGYPEESELAPGRYAVETDECIMYDCVAWMPLPEPYHITNPGKKESEDE